MAATTPSRLPMWILLGASLGLLTGISIGERATLFQPLGIAYAKMLEISVYPYLVCSLFVGLGALTRERASRLFQASWGVYLLLWGVTFGTIWLMAMVLPPTPAPNLLTPGDATSGITLLDLLIPANIALAFDRNSVPAIVIFALLFSVAIQAVPQKAAFLETMEVLRKASLSIWTWIVYFAPIGVFALFASTAGTVAPDAAREMAVYMGLFLIGTGLLAFVVLPVLLCGLIPQSYGELLRELRPAFTLALVTTLSVAALPLIQRAAENLARKEGIAGEQASDVARASLSIGYVLAQLGNYFIALFVLYVGYHERTPLSFGQQLTLPLMTLLSGLGSPSASVDAVAFLSSWLGLPAGTPDLYVETMTVTRYGQVAVSVMSFAFITLAVMMIYFRKSRFRWPTFLLRMALGLALFGVVVGGGRMLRPVLFPPQADAQVMSLTLDPVLKESVNAVVHRERPPVLDPVTGAGSLDGIKARGRLRVGYGRSIVPFSYFNGAGDLVGYDVAAAYRLAHDLQVGIDFVPLEWPTLEDDLEAHRFDIVMAGAYATPDRLRRLDVSDFYLINPVAMIVKADQAARFRTYEEITARHDLTLAVFRDPVLQPLASELFPNARTLLLASYDQLPTRPDIDGAVWTRDQAAAWTSARQNYTAVVPANTGVPLPLAYLLPPGSNDMVRYVNLWLELENTNGARDLALDYWVRGRPRTVAARRWNLIDDVAIPLLARGHSGN